MRCFLTGVKLTAGTNSVPSLQCLTNTATGLNFSGSDSLALVTGSNTNLVLNSNGTLVQSTNVSNSSSAALLTLSRVSPASTFDTYSSIDFSYGGSAIGRLGMYTEGSGSGYYTLALHSGVAGILNPTPGLRINSVNNVGIGGLPSYRLHVYSSNSDAVQVESITTTCRLRLKDSLSSAVPPSIGSLGDGLELRGITSILGKINNDTRVEITPTYMSAKDWIRLVALNSTISTNYPVTFQFDPTCWNGSASSTVNLRFYASAYNSSADWFIYMGNTAGTDGGVRIHKGNSVQLGTEANTHTPGGTGYNVLMGGKIRINLTEDPNAFEVFSHSSQSVFRVDTNDGQIEIDNYGLISTNGFSGPGFTSNTGGCNVSFKISTLNSTGTITNSNLESNKCSIKTGSGNDTKTLPASVVGKVFYFINNNAGGSFTVQANTGQTIRWGTNITSSGGSISTSSIGSTITLLGISTTEWVAISIVGTWT